MKVYKLRENKETGVSVVNIKSKNLTNSEDEILTKCPGDLFLIFPEFITNYIDPMKFSNLYGATWYGVYKNDSVFGFWDAIDYLESLTKYTSISVIDSRVWLWKNLYGILEKLQYSGIETSVFKSRELTKEEKSCIYTIKPKIFELAFGIRYKWFGKKDNIGAYSRMTLTDPIMFLRPSSIQGIRDKLTPEILKSFKGLGIGSLISSLIPPETYINVNIDEASI